VQFSVKLSPKQKEVAPLAVTEAEAFVLEVTAIALLVKAVTLQVATQV
jgi:hypothetical protein